jgi:hypothetical protein
MPSEMRRPDWILRSIEILYVLFVILSFYTLVASRTGEAQTVWQGLHPAFLPVLFVATSLLLVVSLSTGNMALKMFFIMVHSILVHSLFSIIFPAGDLSGQQIILGHIRRVYDNTVLHGLSGWPSRSLLILIVESLEGSNLQAVLSTIFARMFSLDIFYVHLYFVPVLWGVFVPFGSFLVAKSLSGSEQVAILSALLASAFPYTIYFGAISVPNSLGFIFFLYSLYFMIKYLSTSDSKTSYWMVAFSVFAFLSHFLTGFVAFSLLLLTIGFKSYKTDRVALPASAKTALLSAFIAAVSILPLSFVYLGFLGYPVRATFTLSKFSDLPPQEIAGLFLLGELIYGYSLGQILLVIFGATIAVFTMIYLIFRSGGAHMGKGRIPAYFLMASFAVMLVDYRILKIFMDGLPLNAERLWVFQDFLAAPFVGFAFYSITSWAKTLLKVARGMPERRTLRVSGLLLTLNILIPIVLSGWITFSLTAGYPQIAPLQTTWYELDAVRTIDSNAPGRYVVIGDVWTIFAGERIVGVHNPRAYYFEEYNKTGYDLFASMTGNPSQEVMLQAMNQTHTTVAYFIVTQPRIGDELFYSIVARAEQNGLPLYGVFGDGKLYVFYYEKQV